MKTPLKLFILLLAAACLQQCKHESDPLPVTLTDKGIYHGEVYKVYPDSTTGPDSIYIKTQLAARGLKIYVSKTKEFAESHSLLLPPTASSYVYHLKRSTPGKTEQWEAVFYGATRHAMSVSYSSTLPAPGGPTQINFTGDRVK